MHLQPPLHELVSCLRAPTTCLSSRDGQIHLRGAQGVYHRDVRVLARGLLQVQGGEPEPVMTVAAGPSRTCFVAVVRGVADRGADPALTLVRERQACGDGLTERISISSGAESPVRLTVTLHLGADDRAMDAIKGGRPPGSSGPTVTGGDGTLGWDADGLAVLAAARALATPPEVVRMTAYGTAESAVAAMKAGAADYVLKPFAMDELRLRVRRLAAQRSAESRSERLLARLTPELVAESPAMKRLLSDVQLVAPTEGRVLLNGENGSGGTNQAAIKLGQSQTFDNST